MSRLRSVAAIRLDLACAEASMETARAIIRARLNAKTSGEFERALIREGISAGEADRIVNGPARLPDPRVLERRVNRLRSQLARAGVAS